MQNKIPESEIQEIQSLELTEVQQKLYKEAQDELDKFNHDISTKKYFVDLKKEEIKILQDFIEKDAKWKFMESLGIGEVGKELSKSIDKTNKAFIPGTAIEAIYYYLSKVEGVGKKVDSSAISDVETYLKLLKAINVARNAISLDTEKQKQLEYALACRAEGLDPSDPEIKN
jgi:hypothetical protein